MASAAASSSAVPPAGSAAEPAPTPQQLLFARAVILTFELWPAMRLAVSEEWGGPDSLDKRDYLISYLCDEHGDAGAANQPDIDDLAETLESYIADEFECRLDDGSPDWVAGRIVGLHKAIFTDNPDEANKGQEAVAQLETAFQELKGKKTNASAGQDQSEVHDHHGHGDSDDDDEMDEDDQQRVQAAQRMVQSHGGVMEADRLGAEAGNEQRARRERQEPIIDEDGFETVTRKRK
ncbi:uncharacterized protein PFL1_00685 [Pseudozyma flocculosa PF-1]|uniref:Related to TSR2 - protein with a potential role in pre-rRNA processing n=1 Tax=Pseudozyma flocculosa TaxID=84751 RepID=A0A5C3F3G3_9BASI|nr:uncharacterized protein PFL1_00685 [Pseudozyma flocculosa PF-1]EPQ31350.1 hypothetical protein PFL1_00685 [Pseudozyma flocculosa PF-1]SPO38872.1 related to TSR2 - protein with a potential role in pre-rRNA processing [Pseudozyma flocculosa]